MKRLVSIVCVIALLYVASFWAAVYSPAMRAMTNSAGMHVFSTNRHFHEFGKEFYLPVHSLWPGVRWAEWDELVHFGV